MSPRSPNNPRCSSAPYPRRSPGQPKSSRQQFSACGACRMRRVRCDLKDLPPDMARPHSPACSNCKERGLKCVDEFADVKAVKLLRRGRRLQQVEAIYGKTADADHTSPSSSSAALSPVPRPQATIPSLQPEFFSSPFWTCFMMQRPILDPTEFSLRFFAHHKGTHPFSNEASLIAMLLVVWAASFGVDERGVEEAESEQLENNRERDATRDMMVDTRRRETRERTDSMVKEVLTLIDAHGVMRQPTWDGVRVLLLILPLMHEVQPPLDRLIMYEATLAQIHALSALASHPSGSYGSDTLVKARVFWYAYTHEGMSTGLRGGRLVLDGDDLDNFQRTLPPFVGVGSDLPPSLPSPVSPTFSPPHSPPLMLPLSHHHQQQQLHQQPPQHRSPSYLPAPHLFALPLLLSGVCRKVHEVLTGRKAQARAHNGGAGAMMEGLGTIWDGLDRCWEEFDVLKRNGGINQAEADTERYVAGWQIFIFECHNIIRESLKELILSNSPPGSTSNHANGHSPNPSHPHPSPHRLHALAMRKCMRLLPRVLRIIKMHVDTSDSEGSGLFRWDAGLVRDGCFFAGYLAAGESREALDGADGFGDRQDFKDDAGPGMSPEESVDVCLRALSEMRWAFSKAEEREQTVRMVWDTRRMRGRAMREYHGQIDLEGDGSVSGYHQSQQHSPYGDHNSIYAGKPLHHHAQAHSVLPLAPDRPPLAPLSLTHSPHMGSSQGSAPNTACTDGSASGWPVYTPPGTATSGSGSGNGGSPGYSGSTIQPFAVKGEVVGDYYQHPGVSVGDLDPFSFNAGTEGIVTAGYHGHGRPPHSSSGSSGYRDAGVVFCASGSAVIPHSHSHGGSDDGCPQFGEDCGFYH